MTLQPNNSNTSKTESGFLIQSGNSLNGSLLLTGTTNCPGIGSAQGQVSGSNLTITVSQVGQTVNLQGALGTNNSVSGTYSIFASPCGSTQVGSWMATQVQPLTGNFTAAFSSTVTSGLTFQASGKVQEGTNTGSSMANLAGSINSNDAPCFSSASITGSISGTAVVFNLLSSEGLALGQIHGTASTGATSITGRYDFSNTLPPPLNGCEDFGTITISLTP